MEFLDHLLGAEGCNVDGTVNRNPFTAMMEQVFENQHSAFPFDSQPLHEPNILFSNDNVAGPDVYVQENVGFILHADYKIFEYTFPLTVAVIFTKYRILCFLRL